MRLIITIYIVEKVNIIQYHCIAIRAKYWRWLQYYWYSAILPLSLCSSSELYISHMAGMLVRKTMALKLLILLLWGLFVWRQPHAHDGTQKGSIERWFWFSGFYDCFCIFFLEAAHMSLHALFGHFCVSIQYSVPSSVCSLPTSLVSELVTY